VKSDLWCYQKIEEYLGHEFIWYRLHDQKSVASRAPIKLTSRHEADLWNPKGYGIFHATNKFKNGHRTTEDLEKIICWHADCDYGSKAEQYLRVTDRKNLPLIPSMVIESGNGFHVYYFAKDATKENWVDIVGDRLKEYFLADSKALLLTQLLRVPGYLHTKDQSNPFLVKILYYTGVMYSEKEMLWRFRPPEHLKHVSESRAEMKIVCGGVWEKIYNLNQMQALNKISGKQYVNGELFTFKKNRNENWNIFVNGNSTSCFIDKEMRIGSLDGGGPTIFQWLKWYGIPGYQAFQIIKEEFSEQLK